MANSRRYIKLENRVKAIELLYLPATNPTGNYTKKEQDDIRAYLLLVHAEVEAYFEETSESKAKDAFNKWKNHRTKSNVLLSLVSFHESKITEQNIETRVNNALSTFIYSLRHNHGIKEDNILSILLPIGFEYSEIDVTWLNTITSFGTSRGEIAHTAAHVQQPLDPVTLKSTVQQVMSEIKIIDEKLKRIK
ncbi:HEPN domain-containing protein [Algoriphagus sp. NG3]|uniref:HEPN domain-containing protein n=1 Tax=Algoriphagus sp. NG3 TaxID=3097546 RepID=UPI002A7F6CC3|nr:HEPN domain-containing protein [Algoriphagus sp. NG3]WPR77701.1 HEPN domain-containing protein [Algoriphagus sp. NG3]